MSFTNKFYFFAFGLSGLLIFLRSEIIFGDNIIAPFTDDFYYYLNTANNFLKLGLISFDKINLTNGYQPLWFFFILLLKWIIINEILFNSIVFISILLFSFGVYYNSKKFFKSLNYSDENSNFIAILTSYLTLYFSKNGMEIALAIFLFSWSLLYLKKNLLIFSFLSFLTFLTRLEFIYIFFFILFNEYVINKKIFIFNNFIKLLFLPILLVIYVLINLYFFNVPFPESGIAKSLQNEIKFNKETFSFIESNGYGMKFITSIFYFNCIGVFFLFSKKLKYFTKISIITLIVFFILNCLRSPWPLWTWHFFFMAISTPLLANDLIKLLFPGKIKIITNLISIFFVIAYSFLLKEDFNIKNDHILNIAVMIKTNYKNSDKEVFAMGDMAGKTSYLLDKKLIQLEGLVSGKKMINNIKNEKNLCKVLKELNVDVYLASKIKYENNKIFLEEPSISSQNARKMKGEINIKPNKIFNSGNINIYAFESNKNNTCF